MASERKSPGVRKCSTRQIPTESPRATSVGSGAEPSEVGAQRSNPKVVRPARRIRLLDVERREEASLVLVRSAAPCGLAIPDTHL